MHYSRHTRNMKLAAASALLLIRANGQVPDSAHRTMPPAQEHVRELIASLPQNSRMRYVMQRGETGDGVRRPWMDDMRREGVRFAELTFEFSWARKGRQLSDWRLTISKYFRDYDARERITDPRQLQDIESSGLARQLDSAGLPLANGGVWFEHPRQLNGTGYTIVAFADDEWLPATLGTQRLAQLPPGLTPLMQAAILGDDVRIEGLLRSGVSVNAANRLGETALISAAAGGDAFALDLLLKAGADVNANPRGKGNALVAAVANDQPRIVSLLLSAGADPNSMNGEGETALLIATRRHSDEIAQLLRRAGARP
jgi:hypothetical protein